MPVAPMPTAFVQFKHCKVFIWNPDYLETVFPDGLISPAFCRITPATLDAAQKHGYGTNVRAMYLDHELLHTFIFEALGEPHSPVLRRVAERLKAQTGEAEQPLIRVETDEDRLIFAFQRYLRTGQITPFLEQIPRYAWLAQEYSSRFSKLLDDVRNN